MRIYLRDQSYRFSHHLDALRDVPVMGYDIAQMGEAKTSIEVNPAKPYDQLSFGALFDYHIFPVHIMTALPQWIAEGRPMRSRDNIVQQVFIPPGRFSQKIIFGVRIKELICEEARFGYSYETLEGHVEKGISTFLIERTNDQRLVFSIHTFSRPGSVLSRLLAPVFSLPYQKYCTAQALKHMKKSIEMQV
ncbi:MAG: DUF1990 family protein [Bacteroidota bacterium]